MAINNGKNKINRGSVAETKFSGLAFSWLLVSFFALSFGLSIILTLAKVEEPYPDWAIYLQYLLFYVLFLLKKELKL